MSLAELVSHLTFSPVEEKKEQKMNIQYHDLKNEGYLISYNERMPLNLLHVDIVQSCNSNSKNKTLCVNFTSWNTFVQFSWCSDLLRTIKATSDVDEQKSDFWLTVLHTVAGIVD